LVLAEKFGFKADLKQNFSITLPSGLTSVLNRSSV